jgi:glycosyltransferase involved in cell wall biosynthesis
MVEASGAKPPLISVIIPFYGADIGSLRACLIAIAAQEYPGDCVEVIVVDNNPEPVLSSRSQGFSRSCRLAHEPAAGSYSAEHSLSLARGGDAFWRRLST